jgi:hypothetical protein
MTQSRKIKLISQILWDTQLSVEEACLILDDKILTVGHINKSFIFKRCLETYSWFTLLDLFSLQEIKHLLTSEIIIKLRSKALQRKYFFMHDLLQKSL